MQCSISHNTWGTEAFVLICTVKYDDYLCIRWKLMATLHLKILMAAVRHYFPHHFQASWWLHFGRTPTLPMMMGLGLWGMKSITIPVGYFYPKSAHLSVDSREPVSLANGWSWQNGEMSRLLVDKLLW